MPTTLAWTTLYLQRQLGQLWRVSCLLMLFWATQFACSGPVAALSTTSVDCEMVVCCGGVPENVQGQRRSLSWSKEQGANLAIGWDDTVFSTTQTFLLSHIANSIAPRLVTVRNLFDTSERESLKEFASSYYASFTLRSRGYCPQSVPICASVLASVRY